MVERGTRLRESLCVCVRACVRERVPVFLPFLTFDEKGVQALADGNGQAVLSLCIATMGPWFNAHVPVLLDSLPGASKLLYSRIPRDGADQAEMLTLDYVMCLATSQVTWALAADYLSW